jgi:hypothetical protein
MDARAAKFNESQLDWNNFACVRYPPPLEQRRSCETDLRLNQRTIIPVEQRFFPSRIRPDLAANVYKPPFVSLDGRKKVMKQPVRLQARGRVWKFLHAHHVRVRHESRA